jgi:flavin reductase (DIM6/NTAB) family NADH-FMN oxidoreductase RutF
MSILFDSTSLDRMERQARTTLINSLSGVRTAFIAITADSQGRLNASTLSNVTHVGAHPAQMSILFRPDNGKRHTLQNFLNGSPLTLVCMPFNQVNLVHEVSMNAPKGTFELDVLEASTCHVEGCPHPLPKDYLYAISLDFVERFTLNNGCIYTVGQINSIATGAELKVDEEGQISFDTPPTLAIGLRQYTTTETAIKLPYPNAAKYGF